MTRRSWVVTLLTAALRSCRSIGVNLVGPDCRTASWVSRQQPLRLNVVWDNSAIALRPKDRRHAKRLLSECCRGFASAGLLLEPTETGGSISRYRDRLRFSPLRRDSVNVFITDYLPACVDRGRALRGVALFRDGHYIVMLSAREATRYMLPIVATNTLTHELIHVLRGDVHRPNPRGLVEFLVEARTEWRASLYMDSWFAAPHQDPES